MESRAWSLEAPAAPGGIEFVDWPGLVGAATAGVSSFLFLCLRAPMARDCQTTSPVSSPALRMM